MPAAQVNGDIHRSLRSRLHCGRLLLAALGASCASSSAPIPEDTSLGTTPQAIHNEPLCALRNLGFHGARLAIRSAYGNWCGGTNVGPGDPVNCWDDGCRTHDFSYHGPQGSGYVSCHDVINTALCGTPSRCNFGVPLPDSAPDTACIQAADTVLCGDWDRCTSEKDAAQATWHWESGNGRTHRRIRRCNDPAAGNNGAPVRCSWYEHPVSNADEVWTCGVCPGAPPAPPVLPNPACAVVANASSTDKLTQCCGDHSGDVRPKVCECPDDKPVRRPAPSGQVLAVQCIACPPNAPSYNKMTQQCEPCPQGTTWNPSTLKCESSNCPSDWQLVPRSALSLGPDGTGGNGLRAVYSDGTIVLGEGPIWFGPHDAGDVPSWYPADRLADASAPALWRTIWGIGGETLTGYVQSPKTGTVEFLAGADDYSSIDVGGLSSVGDNTGSAGGAVQLDVGVWYPITLGYQNRWGSNGFNFFYRCP